MITAKTPFKTKPTLISHKKSLIKVLKKMNYPIYFNQEIKGSDVPASVIKVDIAVDIGSSYYVGFSRRNSHYYKMIADWDGISRTSNYTSLQFIKSLQLAYSTYMKSKRTWLSDLLQRIIRKKKVSLLSRIFNQTSDTSFYSPSLLLRLRVYWNTFWKKDI